jgi:hypothetical protein
MSTGRKYGAGSDSSAAHVFAISEEKTEDERAMDRDTANNDRSDNGTSAEIRTRRLVVIDDEGIERAVLTTHLEHVELRVGNGRRGAPLRGAPVRR